MLSFKRINIHQKIVQNLKNLDDQKNYIQQLKMNISKNHKNQTFKQTYRPNKQKRQTQFSEFQQNSIEVHQQILFIPLISYGLFSFQKKSEIKIFCHLIYKQVNYAINNLQMPSSSLLLKRKINIPLTNKKLLFLDLDETIIHCDDNLIDSQIQIYNSDFNLKMNFRPHWKKFLTKISKFFDIYIFTSSTEKYANSIVNFLNEDHKFIKGILHRSHCLRTKNGFFIKDLRIIENVDMKKVVIVDNKIQSFSFQLQNGVPIQQFKSNSNDQTLLKLEQFLIEVYNAEDVQLFLSKTLRLREIIKKSQAQFTRRVYQMFEQNISRNI